MVDWPNYTYYNGDGHMSVNGTLEMSRFEGGYFDADGNPYYYLTDYEGNVVRVIDETGLGGQPMDYYPYGEPWVEWDWARADTYPSFIKNRFLYGGKERITQFGLGLYNFEARMYRAQLGRFSTPDKKAIDTPWLSPFAYCANNPVNLIDPTGLAPTGYEAALMASAAYKDEETYDYNIDTLSDNDWIVSPLSEKISIGKGKTLADISNAILFEKRHDDNSIEYALAYAGTQDISDGIQDALQMGGLSSEYTKAVSVSKVINQQLSSSELTFVGHSYGGGKAAISSMATGCQAITFNPAALSRPTILFNQPLGNGDITNYISATPSIMGVHLVVDYVTWSQIPFHLVTPGKKVPVSVGWTPSHSIDKIVKALAPK